ncbi:NUDIX hydrolase domain-like protein [Pelagophyceae sp. CCMP2097]|nr:NUDIX hydrolase domain-like protein [Pelagophyceae sp. CCMP2097]
MRFSCVLMSSVAFVDGLSSRKVAARVGVIQPEAAALFDTAALGDSATRVLLHHGGKQLVFERENKLVVAWQPFGRLHALGLRTEEDDSPDASGLLAVSAVAIDGDADNLAVDVSILDETAVVSACAGDSRFVDTRTLLVQGAPDASAAAGFARALLNWHAVHLFCGSCGSPTTSQQGGAKRVCSKCSKRAYPRVDPVVVGLVSRNDELLLGRSKKLRPGMYTCLSGFVGPCERAEDAFVREVFEESGIVLKTADLKSSQPWPIGRSSSCELMIACVAEADDGEILIDDVEMDDVRWFCRAQVRQLFEASLKYTESPAPEGTLFLPGSYAIAHHLIKNWLDKG